MGKFFKTLLLTTSLFLGVAAVGLNATPAAAFWVDEYRLANISKVHEIQKEEHANYIDGSNSQVFLNEVDPTWRVKNFLNFTPTLARYEIAAPNGTDLTGWKFLIYENQERYVPWSFPIRFEYIDDLMQTVDLTTAFADGPVFKDQQQGWGFKSFTGAAPRPFIAGHVSIIKEADPNAHYVLLNDKGEVVQALAYRHEHTITSGPQQVQGVTTRTIKGFSHLFRKGARLSPNFQGSWKFNNVWMTPDSTYGSLQIFQGYEGAKYNPAGPNKQVQWYNPVPNRHALGFTDDILLKPFNDRWDRINFVPEDRPTICTLGVKWIYRNQWGPDFCNMVGDEGYFFDEWGGGSDDIPAIEDRVLKTGQPFTLKITNHPVAKGQVEFDKLPKGLTYDKNTGILSGVPTETFPKQRFVLKAYNPDFYRNGYNGHGFTYRTFFWSGEVGNRPPVVTFPPAAVREGTGGTIPGQVVDPDGDKIVKVEMTALDPKGIPAGITLGGTNTNPTITITKDVKRGLYPVKVTAWDEHNNSGFATVDVVVGAPIGIDISVPQLVTPRFTYGESLITYTAPDSNPVTFELKHGEGPGSTAVPVGVEIAKKDGKFYVTSDGRAEVGSYKLTVHGTSKTSKGKAPFYLHIKPPINTPPSAVGQDYVAQAGKESKIAFRVQATGKYNLALYVLDKSATSYFSLDNSNPRQPRVVVHAHAKPGVYFVNAIAIDVNNPESRTNTWMQITVAQTGSTTTVSVDNFTAIKGDGRTAYQKVKINGPSDGAKIDIYNQSSLPSGIGYQAGFIYVRDSVPVGNYSVVVRVVANGYPQYKTITITVTE